MRVVLLGPNGQLGHDVQRACAEAGEPFELVPLARDRLDVSVAGAVERVLGETSFDAVLNCIGTNAEDMEDNATLAFSINTHAVKAMARVCAAKGARFVHLSTDYVFGGDTARARPFREDDPTAPVNVYGASKAMGETLVRLVCEDAIVLRVAALFGVAGSRSNSGGNFVETAIRVAREKGALQVVDDQTISPTSTADVARILSRVLREGCEPGIYHAVNSGITTRFAFACEIVRRVGVDATVTPCSSADYPSRIMRPRYTPLDNAKVSAAFGPPPPWQDALDRYLRAKGHAGGAAA